MFSDWACDSCCPMVMTALVRLAIIDSSLSPLAMSWFGDGGMGGSVIGRGAGFRTRFCCSVSPGAMLAGLGPAWPLWHWGIWTLVLGISCSSENRLWPEFTVLANGMGFEKALEDAMVVVTVIDV